MVLDDSWRAHTEKFGHAGIRPAHIAAFLLALVNFCLNGMIWFAFHACPIIISKSHLHHFYALAVTNCFTGFFSIPTFLNLFAHNNINCPKWSIIVGSAFEMGLDRARAIFVLAIALERLYAIFRPRVFFLCDHRKNAKRVYALAIIWSTVDAMFMIFEDGLATIRTHCVPTSSSGPIFHAYFLLMTLIDGLLLLTVYVVFLAKFCSFRKALLKPASVTVKVGGPGSKYLRRQGHIKHQIGQANALTLSIICCVLVFSVLPSALYSYDMVMGKVIFMDLGPVITIGYHLHGITSSFCYNYKHREIRRILDKVYPKGNGPCLTHAQDVYVSNVRVEVM